MDIGSYIEIEMRGGCEYFKDIADSDIVRLNTCRAAIYHAVICYGVKKVWIAKYQCDVVRDFLIRKGLEVLYYDMDELFNPVMESNDPDTAIVFTNYFGVLGDKHFDPLVKKYNNVIIDNAQAFYAKPRFDCINCYSPRKFFAAPDGAYVVGKNVNICEYERDISSDTSQFLLMRYEYGCDGAGYANKKANDKRIDESDILSMSKLTYVMLDSVDYDYAYKKRYENYLYAREKFDKINELDVSNLFENECAPMGYPLLLKDVEVIPEFHKNRIFQARFWEYLIDEKYKDTREYILAKHLALICTDQRYGKKEIDFQYSIVEKLL